MRLYCWQAPGSKARRIHSEWQVHGDMSTITLSPTSPEAFLGRISGRPDL